MSKVNKAIAEEVATKMTATKTQKLEDDFKQLFHEAAEHHLSLVPEEIKQLAKEFPEYIFQSKSVCCGWEMGYKYAKLRSEEKMPTKTGGNRNVDPTHHNLFIKRFQSLTKQEEAIKTLQKEIYDALMSLRSYSRIEKEFNEAHEYLPERTTTALVVNVSSIREKLK